MHYILMCRSLTVAQRTARALQAQGIFAVVAKAPQSANPNGCTYGAKIGERNLTAALDVLHAANITIIKLLRLEPNGAVSEVAL